MEFLRWLADETWRQAMFLPGGSKSDLHRFAHRIDICTGNKDRWKDANGLFEQEFRRLPIVPRNADDQPVGII